MEKMQNPLVSILVPFYNVEKYVGKCVESLFNQTYSNIEYVFVDDCSPDNSLKIIKDMIDEFNIPSERYNIVIHKTNMGISTSRNDCITNAKGDYILFIDSDDWIEIDMVEKLVNATKENNADISGCSYIEEYPDKSIYFSQKYTNDHLEMMKAITILTIKGVMWKLLIKRSVIVNNNIKFIPDNNMVDDYLFCCQVFYYARTFASVDEYLYHYIQYNPNNYSHVTLFNIESQAKAVEETEKFYKDKGIYDELKNELNQRKFLLKLPLILDQNCINTNKWRTIFPECNNAWKDMNFSIGNKLMFKIAQSFLHPLIRVFRNIK